MSDKCIKVRGLKKCFQDHENKEIVVLENLDFEAKAGEITIIMGPSGCGKSTLLNILSTIDNIFDDGKVEVLSNDITSLNESKKASFRNENIGFIFQSHELIAEFNVLENCAIPLKLQGTDQEEAYKDAEDLLLKFNIPAINHKKFPRQLSGGQQQRVGIIRAMINKPNIIFADEPTGNLDRISRDIVNKELKNLVKPSKHNPDGIALIIVTHDSIYEDETFSQSVYKFEEIDEQSSENLKYTLVKKR
ncbi:MAG: ABC transporter ATP-binding protein [Campylobacterota bacterium]|nr:ABC transporter ATP-binding protein [Campylobacterota bacterium]